MMHKGRLEAFSDGVLAIIITIMVLELKIPHGETISALIPDAPVFLSYVLSYMYVAIYWNNHHHLFQIVKHVTGPILWANIHLLFWLSLIPFVTAWCGENHFASLPVAFYGVILLMAAIAYFILVQCLIHEHGRESDIAQAFGSDFKGKVSAVAYAIAIPLAFLSPYLSLAIYFFVGLGWLIPDSRVEQFMRKAEGKH